MSPSTNKSADVIANALGCLIICELNSCPRSDSDAVLVTTMPMAVEIISDGI